MAKAIVVISSTQVENLVASVSYSASVINGGSPYSYGSSYTVNTGISLAANLTAMRNKVIAEAAANGVTLLTADVIVFGAPS